MNNPEHGGDPGLPASERSATWGRRRGDAGFNVRRGATVDAGQARDGLLLAELRQALLLHELIVYYQPVVAASGGISHVEALVRWQHPRLGLVMPDDFIPLVEANGLITELTYEVFRLVLQQIRAWNLDRFAVTVAVNVSARSAQDARFPGRIAALLQEHGVPAEQVRFEVTETEDLEDANMARKVLALLQGMGIRISLDDFGTGLNTLARLWQFRVDELKIDKRYVQALVLDPGWVHELREIVQLAHSLGLHVVAEGIEDERSWRTLLDLGCDAGQGYLFSKAIPAADLAGWLKIFSATQGLEPEADPTGSAAAARLLPPAVAISRVTLRTAARPADRLRSACRVRSVRQRRVRPEHRELFAEGPITTLSPLCIDAKQTINCGTLAQAVRERRGMGTGDGMGNRGTDTCSVFLVDDQPDSLLLMCALLDGQLDLVVVGEASSGQHAIATILDVSPHLAVIDVEMPGMNGFETAQRLKAIMPELHVVMVSAEDKVGYDDLARAVGASDFLSKKYLSATRISGHC